jgi:uncharacterized membrane protein YedE/YeeE
MVQFTPVASLLGGMLIGLSASALLLFNGKIAGVSGIVGGLFSPIRNDTLWRAVFVAGLLTGGVLLQLFSPQAFTIGISRSTGALIVAGLLVGYGTRLGNGCTSGHGVCGVSRFSPRSLLAPYTSLIIFLEGNYELAARVISIRVHLCHWSRTERHDPTRQGHGVS